MLVGFEESLLEHVLGVLVVLGDVLGEAVDLVLVVIDQFGEGRGVAFAGLGDQRGFVEGGRSDGHGAGLESNIAGGERGVRSASADWCWRVSKTCKSSAARTRSGGV